MKTQKVEIELPAFDDWEFLRFGKLTQSELDCDDMGILSFVTNTNPHIFPAIACMNLSDCFLYKRKKRRKVILEEYKIDFLQAGDIYIDVFGNINKRFYNDYSQFTKYPILKKIQDDFSDE